MTLIWIPCSRWLRYYMVTQQYVSTFAVEASLKGLGRYIATVQGHSRTCTSCLISRAVIHFFTGAEYINSHRLVSCLGSSLVHVMGCKEEKQHCGVKDQVHVAESSRMSSHSRCRIESLHEPHKTTSLMRALRNCSIMEKVLSGRVTLEASAS